MAKRTQEHHWQFYGTDAADFAARDGASRFERHARELAQTLGCQLVACKDLSLEQIGAHKWGVSGTVSLVKETRRHTIT
jgi:hypothetical protein